MPNETCGSIHCGRCTNAHYTSSQAASLSCQLCTITLKYQITFRSHLQTVQVHLLLQFHCRQPWASFCRILHQIIWCAWMNPAVFSALVFRHFNPSLIPLCPRRFDAITRVCVCVCFCICRLLKYVFQLAVDVAVPEKSPTPIRTPAAVHSCFALIIQICSSSKRINSR